MGDQAGADPFQELLRDLSPETVQLLRGRGADVAAKLGEETMRSVVLDVLSGKNIRTSTEFLTRRRLALLNAATLALLFRATAADPSAPKRIPGFAAESLRERRSVEHTSFAQWFLGITGKAAQNVLRDDKESLSSYLKQYQSTLATAAKDAEAQHGVLSGGVKLGKSESIEMGWDLALLVLTAVGAQTLTIRGSEKSLYGKLFEPVVLGTVLQILGFKLIAGEPRKPEEKVFWFTSKVEKRESDATLIVSAEKGVRFDIGFIGRGNPEITLDKVSRFERQTELAGRKVLLAPVIIVDTVGAGSQLPEKAREMGGRVIQMSLSYWPKTLATVLREATGYDHELRAMPDERIGSYLAEAIARVSFTQLVPIAAQSKAADPTVEEAAEDVVGEVS